MSNLTIALKTNNGEDPSVHKPVIITVGGRLRKVTAPLSITSSQPSEMWTNHYDQFNQFATVRNEKGAVIFKGQIDGNDTFVKINGEAETFLYFHKKLLWRGQGNIVIELRPKSDLNIVNNESEDDSAMKHLKSKGNKS